MTRGRLSRTGLYRRSLAQRARRRRMADAVLDGFWLGVLDPDHFRRLDRSFFVHVREMVDGVARTYRDREHIEQGLSGWERSAVSTFRPGGDVLVTAAGAGREVLGLTEMGFQAWGFEPNADLVAAGRLVLPDPGRLQQSAYDAFPSFDRPLDGVVIGWGSLMLLPDRAARGELLHGAHEALRPGGRILVSYFDRTDGHYFTLVHAIATAVRRLRGRPPPQFGDALSPNFVHYFAPAEVRAELEDAGFEVVLQHQKPYGHTVAMRPDS